MKKPEKPVLFLSMPFLLLSMVKFVLKYCLVYNINFQAHIINVYLTAGCFTCCLTSGLRVYNVDPLVEKAHYSKC